MLTRWYNSVQTMTYLTVKNQTFVTRITYIYHNKRLKNLREQITENLEVLMSGKPTLKLIMNQKPALKIRLKSQIRDINTNTLDRICLKYGDRKNKKLKKKIQAKQIKPLLYDPDIKPYLKALHKLHKQFSFYLQKVIKPLSSSQKLDFLTQNLKHILKLYISLRK